MDDGLDSRHSEQRMLHVIAAHQGRPSDDPIFALNREATQRRDKGEAIVNATVGSLLDDDGRLSVLPTAARVVREVPEGDWAAYAPIAGTPGFLSAVIEDLFSTQPRLKESALAVATPGGTGALRHAVDNFLERGQSILTTSYYWGPYKTLTDEADRRVATFSMFDASGSLDIDALDRALREQVKAQGRVLLFLNDPCHNPTGYSMRPAEWKAVVLRLLAHSETAPITLLVDCAYFAYAPGDPRAFLAELVPLLGRVGLLFAWSASKTFTHYGLRVGALVACLVDEAERTMTSAALSYSSRGTWSNCNRGGLTAITRLLVDPELSKAANSERESLKRMLQERVRAFNVAAPLKKLAYPRYDGGFFVTVFHREAEAKALAMKEMGVFVVPQPGALRVALCGVAERDVERLVAALAD
jgi:aromatic-amino-acid transaminase